MTAANASWCGDCWCATNNTLTCPPRPQNYSTAFTEKLQA
jgi:hypothetical protein